ncbi:MAG: DegT/DnrJ/EryC1/StrS family aminotransferase [Kordiimonadaceae bacterium]|nr:DegT/DnrJ/EryC1/StrS family aminotransferase [Kordiimonadaceae bacterium]MBO6569489.1 DegT/DnrJ/EryC1/StrS family aminotransferase [Kordiimonadaceae bacterium]MBO6964964.1 DegT/DnrJ/EryC1/StrS family aminotransferase [Kordiimonadaceae bacterium]
MSEAYKIQCLVPDLPESENLLPFLQEMQQAKWYSNFGPLNSRFEDSMKSFIASLSGFDDFEVVTFTSATTALEAALASLELPKGANVLIPALTFPATATAVINAGHTPVFSDVEEESWSLSPDIAAQMSKRKDFAAVMPVAVFGRPLDVAAWDAYAVSSGKKVVIDAAAALGQQAAGRHVHMAFSLHATKPFSVGEGGLLVSPDAELAKRARSWSNFGFLGPGGVISQVGTNAKMGEFYAAVGLAQLNRWEDVLAKRTAIMEAYLAGLKSLDNKITLQQGAEAFVPATLVVKTQGKALLLADELAQVGVHTRFWYLPPLYEHPALAQYAIDQDPQNAFPVTEGLKHDLIGLPFHSFLTDDDVSFICETVASYV